MNIYKINETDWAILVENSDTTEISSRLAKHQIDFKIEGPAVFGGITDGVTSFVIKAKKEDIQFALEDCIKLLRPYPKNKRVL